MLSFLQIRCHTFLVMFLVLHFSFTSVAEPFLSFKVYWLPVLLFSPALMFQIRCFCSPTLTVNLSSVSLVPVLFDLGVKGPDSVPCFCSCIFLDFNEFLYLFTF